MVVGGSAGKFKMWVVPSSPKKLPVPSPHSNCWNSPNSMQFICKFWKRDLISRPSLVISSEYIHNLKLVNECIPSCLQHIDHHGSNLTFDMMDEDVDNIFLLHQQGICRIFYHLLNYIFHHFDKVLHSMTYTLTQDDYDIIL